MCGHACRETGFGFQLSPGILGIWKVAVVTWCFILWEQRRSYVVVWHCVQFFCCCFVGRGKQVRMLLLLETWTADITVCGQTFVKCVHAVIIELNDAVTEHPSCLTCKVGFRVWFTSFAIVHYHWRWKLLCFLKSWRNFIKRTDPNTKSGLY